MSLAAQLAQHSKLYKAGTGGAAVNITAITPGFPTVITSVAHGLSNGDSGPIADVVGTMATVINVSGLVVKNVTADTFAVDVDTTGLTYTSGGTFTPATWIKVGDVKAINPSGSTSTTIDVSDLDSDAMEFLTGLIDNGTFSCDINVVESDVGQAAILADHKASLSSVYKVETPLKTRTFNASCTKFPTIPTIAVNGVQVGSMEFKISGAVTVS